MKLKKLVSIDNTGVKDFIGDDLKNLFEEVVFYDDFPKEESKIIKRMSGAEGMLVSWQTPITKNIIDALPDLKYIGMCCTLFNEASANVDISAAKEKGIQVVGVNDYGDEGVVEFIICALIQLFKNQTPVNYKNEPIELGEINLGVIGLGTLGEMVARASQHFGMGVSYYNRNEKDCDFEYLSKETLLKKCDVITTHLPRNTKVINENDFNYLGEYSILINTGLSPSYDEDAFLDWIIKPKRFAIFDRVSLTPELIVLYSNFKNITISDHVTGFTWNARRRLAHKAYKNLETSELINL